MSDIKAYDTYRDNSELIHTAYDLGYVKGDVLDLTYGLGVMWKWLDGTYHLRIHRLWRNDLYKELTVEVDSCLDYTKGSILHSALGDKFTPEPKWDTILFDPPYKLNGTDDGEGWRYGVATPTRWQDRMEGIRDGVVHAAQLLKVGGHLLVKCQDQVCSGKIRWQTDMVTETAQRYGCEKVERLVMVTEPRPQPEGRIQVHARQNASTLLIFQKGR